MEQVTLDTISPVSSQAGMVVAKPSDKSITLFDSNSSNSTSNGTFQLLVCDQSPNGDIGIGMGLFYFHANRKYDPRFLWSQWSTADVTLFVAGQAVVLDEDIYASARGTIAHRLGDRTHTLIFPIAL